MNITLLLGGLSLFVFSLESLSKSLIKSSLFKIQNSLKKLTSSFKKSLFTGFFSTLIIQSSSALIMLTITLINSNILSFNQSIGIVLGSNIATTISSFFIGLNLEKISPFFLLISFIFSNSKKPKIANISKTIFYISLLFFSVFLISFSLISLKDSPIIPLYIKRATDNFFLSILIGTLITIALQSSSLFVALLQIFATSSIITPIQAIPLIFGANIGTSFDALITFFSSNKEAKKLSHFSITFNILTTIIFSIFIFPFTTLINLVIDITNATPAISIAIINILFNLLGVIITLPFINKIKRYYSKL